MPRHIDAEKLVNIINPNGLNNPLVPFQDVMRAISITPTEDVTPVVHGHWYFTEYEYFTCSVCGKSYYNGCESSEEARNRLKNGDVFDFCPHCGAKMDEKRKGR